RSKHSRHGATGAAGRSTLITAPPAQPVEALSSRRHRRSRSKHSHHGATGAAGRSTLITAPPAQPVEARRHCETGAAGRSTLVTAHRRRARVRPSLGVSGCVREVGSPETHRPAGKPTFGEPIATSIARLVVQIIPYQTLTIALYAPYTPDIHYSWILCEQQYEV
ncbi:hypothetical protein, partial [Roseiflexus castenholzii]|uniref:hypothetical protein n=1 Tax=Roseiflexus castenholzii TaxID=120962 RepID=UPI003C7A96F3